jgi:hypothetical protein
MSPLSLSQEISLVLAVVIASLFINNAHASRMENAGDNKTIYISLDSGKQINAIEADRLTSLDKQVLSCKQVEKVCSERTGKCSIKAVK